MTPVIPDLIPNPPSTPPVDSRFRGKTGGGQSAPPFILSAPPFILSAPPPFILSAPPRSS